LRTALVLVLSLSFAGACGQNPRPGDGGRGGSGAVGGSGGKPDSGATAGTGGSGVKDGGLSCPESAPQGPPPNYAIQKCSPALIDGISCEYDVVYSGRSCRVKFFCRCVSDHMGGLDCNWMRNDMVCRDAGA
jgi:hypothetical protein